ncbi:class I SAM-dependent methyltransferase [Allomuricauda sp. d1]|uniref:class I SAM-dependent methyltransferase n=1 Tax=Allomuricauda sp. d1 TaxID=3136725 RepID=UPI0031DB78E3
MQDIFGQAVLDFYNGHHTEDIKTFSSFNEEDALPLAHLFREYDDMPILEQKALQRCKGSILDIGCGAGPHSHYLQHHGFDVTALDSSKTAIEVCRARGIEKTIHSSILEYRGTTFDTLLLLMNGIGIVGKLNQLEAYLNHFKLLLNAGGQILLDSTDIIYMYEQDDDGGYWIAGDREYYGEMQFQMQYKGKKGSVFDWLYLDFETLSNTAKNCGFDCHLVSQGPHYDYLARLVPKP